MEGTACEQGNERFGDGGSGLRAGEGTVWWMGDGDGACGNGDRGWRERVRQRQF